MSGKNDYLEKDEKPPPAPPQAASSLSSSTPSTSNIPQNDSSESVIISASEPPQQIKDKALKLKKKYKQSKIDLLLEKEKKQKLYKCVVTLANELKNTKEQVQELREQSNSDERNWYEGGMYRIIANKSGPELLPNIQNNVFQRGFKKEAVSLSDLFFDLVIVTAFMRVGLAIQDNGGLKLPQLFYFVLFWLIWGKEASFATRFDTTDLSSQVVTLLTCFAVLFGSLGSKSDFNSTECTSIMVVALFVALLHFLLHFRVWYWFVDVSPNSELIAVKDYALYVMLGTSLESLTWIVGISLSEQNSKWRWIVFVTAIVFSFRLPRTFLPNDFHAACSKRGVLFILTLGFILQSIVLVASPFFDYQTPSAEQFFFLGLPCFLLFCIKLLYVDDSFSVDPEDHALLVNRAAGFFFHIGQLSLLLATTILGGGLNLLTQSYLAGTAALPNDAKSLVCGGFSGVILSIGFIKSMHIRRVPLHPTHRQLFFAAYGTQVLVLLAVSYTTISLCLNTPGYLGNVALSEMQLLGALCFLSLFLLVISWLDEAVELNLYGESHANAREFRVHPFGLWTCLKPGDPKPPIVSDTSTLSDRRLSHLSPLLTSSNANLFDSVALRETYGSLASGSGSGYSKDDEERVRLVKFSDDTDENGEIKLDEIV
mmetsp:Transcript_11770/g.13689  ORF Transcript_11770/g.13689 Transcript_11770/m.13689 type:complete len:654 (+) Transcript_11770:177-2138(+)